MKKIASFDWEPHARNMNANERGMGFVISALLFMILGVIATVCATYLIDSFGKSLIASRQFGVPLPAETIASNIIESIIVIAIAVIAFFVARRRWRLYVEREIENRKMSSEMLMTKTEEEILAFAGITVPQPIEAFDMPSREMLSWMTDKVFERYQIGPNGMTENVWLNRMNGNDDPSSGYVLALDKQDDAITIILYRI